MTSKVNKPALVSSATANTVTSAKMEAPAPAEGTYYYYYYETPQPTQAIADEQLQQQQAYNNIAGNYYYYYTIDGTADANYNEFLIQPPSNNIENYSSQRIATSWR